MYTYHQQLTVGPAKDKTTQQNLKFHIVVIFLLVEEDYAVLFHVKYTRVTNYKQNNDDFYLDIGHFS